MVGLVIERFSSEVLGDLIVEGDPPVCEDAKGWLKCKALHAVNFQS
jgi:hypothetical protein